MKMSAPSAAAAGPICSARSSSTRPSWTARRCAPGRSARSRGFSTRSASPGRCSNGCRTNSLSARCRTFRRRNRRRARRIAGATGSRGLAKMVRQRSERSGSRALAGRRLGRPIAATPSIRRSAATRPYSWRSTATATWPAAPAHRAGAGNIPAGSATVRSSAPAPTPTAAMAPAPAPAPARWRSAAAPRARSCST